MVGVSYGLAVLLPDLTMNSKKKILVLITGIITALILIFYSYRDLVMTTSFLQKEKPATTSAPAFKMVKQFLLSYPS